MKIRAADQGGEAEVDEDRGERAVDVQRDRLDALAAIAASSARANRMPSPSRPASCARSNRTATRGSIFECTRCPKPGSRVLRLLRFVDQFAPRPRRTNGCRRARGTRPCLDQLHAARSRAAVLVADREDAGGDRRGRRLRGCPTPPAAPRRTTARRRRGPRRRSGWRRARRRSRRRRQPLVMQQEDEVGERRLLHQLEDVVSANSDVVRASVDDGRSPCVHSSGWMLRPCRCTSVCCYGNGTVTPLVCTV